MERTPLPLPKPLTSSGTTQLQTSGTAKCVPRQPLEIYGPAIQIHPQHPRGPIARAVGPNGEEASSARRAHFESPKIPTPPPWAGALPRPAHPAAAVQPARCSLHGAVCTVQSARCSLGSVVPPKRGGEGLCCRKQSPARARRVPAQQLEPVGRHHRALLHPVSVPGVRELQQVAGDRYWGEGSGPPTRWRKLTGTSARDFQKLRGSAQSLKVTAISEEIGISPHPPPPTPWRGTPSPARYLKNRVPVVARLEQFAFEGKGSAQHRVLALRVRPHPARGPGGRMGRMGAEAGPAFQRLSRAILFSNLGVRLAEAGSRHVGQTERRLFFFDILIVGSRTKIRGSASFSTWTCGARDLGETATPASGPRPFLQIPSCAPCPVRVRCRFSLLWKILSSRGAPDPTRRALRARKQATQMALRNGLYNLLFCRRAGIFQMFITVRSNPGKPAGGRKVRCGTPIRPKNGPQFVALAMPRGGPKRCFFCVCGLSSFHWHTGHPLTPPP
eukprot:gene8213-biopygen4616